MNYNSFMISRNRIDLLLELVKTSFKMRYQNSVLGILWVLIKPYSQFIVLYLIWSRIRAGGAVENFSLYLLIGIVFYTYFNEMISLGQMALLDKANIILKVNFPRQISIIATMVSALINLLINIILVIIFIIIANINVSLEGVLYFLFLTICMFIACLGFSLFSSILTIRLRDLKNIFELGLFLLYWLTPIFYSIDNIILGEGITSKIIRYNPIGIVINQVRASLGVYGTIDYSIGLSLFLGSILILIVGWVYFNYKIKKVAEYF